MTQGQLPPGLSLDQATGVISGTPTTEGTFLATYRAALVDGRSDTKSLEIVVRQPLTVAAAKPFATVPLPTVWEVGVPFSAKLTPFGGIGSTRSRSQQDRCRRDSLSPPTGRLSELRALRGSIVRRCDWPTAEGRTADYAAKSASPRGSR